MNKKLSELHFYLLISFGILIFNSCHKQVPDYNDVAQDKTLQNKVILWLKNEKSKLVKQGEDKIDTLSKNLNLADIGIEKLNESEHLILVPLNKDFKTFYNKDKSCISELVLLVNKEGDIRRGDVVQMIPKNSSVLNIPSGLTTDIYNNKKAVQLNCTIAILTTTNKLEHEFTFDNGKLQSDKFVNSKRNQQGSNPNPTPTQRSFVPYYIAWYLVTTYYYTDGSTDVNEQFLGVTCENCGEGYDDNYWSLDTGDQIGGGVNTDYVSLVTVESVTKVLTNPCFINIVNNITDATIKNQIVKLFNQTYVGTGSVANVKFIEDNNLTNADGSPRAAKSSIEGATHTWVISMNPTYSNTASTAFWGGTIAHELIHSFISIYKSQNPPLTQFEQHELIFQKWVNQLSDFLQQSFGLSVSDANALALGGLDGVLKEEVNGDYVFKQKYDQMAQDKYGITLQAAEDKRKQYKDGTLGTICN